MKKGIIISVFAMVSLWLLAAEDSYEGIEIGRSAQGVEGGLPAPYLQFYEQTVQIDFSSSSAAKEASVEMLPLPGNKKWAMSCRWDDNTMPQNLKMLDVMNAEGMKGTWYLNGIPKGEIDAKALLKGGNSVGVHGWTHAYLGSCSRNGYMSEIMQTRIYLEDESDTPVQSMGFAYVNFYDRFEEPQSLSDSTEAIFRSGINGFASLGVRWKRPELHAANMSSVGVPYPDQKSRFKKFEDLWADEEHRQMDPGLVFGLHAWTEVKKLDKIPAVFDLATKNPEVWVCNVDEYLAYRTQFMNVQIESEVDGKSLLLKIRRPVLRDLNRPVPLELKVSGVPAEDIEAVQSPSAVVERTENVGGSAAFAVFHNNDQHVPQRIAWIANPGNEPDAASDSDLPEFSGRLVKEGSQLKLVVDAGGKTLSGIRLGYRLPLAFENGVQYFDVPDSGRIEHQIDLTAQTQNYKYHHGDYFFAAQLDGLLDGEPVRIYLTCTEPSGKTDPSHPINGFVRTGPIPFDAIDMDAVQEFSEGSDSTLTLNGTSYEFSEPPDYQTIEKKGEYSLTIPRKGIDADKIPFLCTWNNRTESDFGCYVYVSTVESPEDMPVQIDIDGLDGRVNKKQTVPAGLEYYIDMPKVYTVAAFLNGERIAVGGIPSGKTTPGQLEKGENRLVVVLQARDDKPASYPLYGGVGLFLRNQQGERLEQVVYRNRL